MGRGGFDRGFFFQLRGARDLSFAELTLADAQRFFSRVKRERDGCLSWRGAVNSDGYGHLYIGPPKTRRDVLAHRFVMALTHGFVSGEKMVDHRCGRRICVDPEHLRFVTHEENTPAIFGMPYEPDEWVAPYPTATYADLPY